MSKCYICYERRDRFSVCLRNHLFCISCIQSYVGYNLVNGKSTISCPFPGCDREVVKNERLLGKTLYIRYINAPRNPLSIQCPKIGCSGLIDIKSGKYHCDECYIRVCNKCFHDHSYLGNCDNENELESLKYKAKNYIRCPMCKVYIEKNGGCDNVVCFYCDKRFDYTISAHPIIRSKLTKNEQLETIFLRIF